MTVKLIANPTFTHAVKLTVPGQVDLAEVQFIFKHLGDRDLEAWVKASQGKTDAAFLAEVIEGWGAGVENEAGPVPYSQEALEKLLDQFHPAGREIFQQYREALRESRLGN